jgi:hypothetical protein
VASVTVSAMAHGLWLGFHSSVIRPREYQGTDRVSGG